MSLCLRAEDDDREAIEQLREFDLRISNVFEMITLKVESLTMFHRKLTRDYDLSMSRISVGSERYDAQVGFHIPLKEYYDVREKIEQERRRDV